MKLAIGTGARGAGRMTTILLPLVLVALFVGCIGNAPQVSIQAQDYYTNKTAGNVRFTVVDDGASLNCSVAVKGVQQFSGMVANNTLTTVPVTLSNGANVITVVCRDAVMNVGTATINVYADAQAPNITYIDFQASL